MCCRRMVEFARGMDERCEIGDESCRMGGVIGCEKAELTETYVGTRRREGPS